MKLRTQRHRTLVQQRHAPATLMLKRRKGRVLVFFGKAALRSRLFRTRAIAAVDQYFDDDGAFLSLAHPRAAIIPR